MDLELKGKVAIVTGGNRGIGKAIGQELAKEGADVAIVARNKAALDAAAAEIGKQQRRKRASGSSPTRATMPRCGRWSPT